MEKLLSTKCSLQSVPESYILPPDTRPGDLVLPPCNNFPIIDLQHEQVSPDHRTHVIQQIIGTGQEFGIFQIVNHGVSEELMRDVLNLAEEFFELPAEDKANVYSDDPKQSCRLHTSVDYDIEKVHYWRDILRHPCHPLEDYLPFWPHKPTQYRKVIEIYSAKMRKLSMRLLDLISEGLGLELDFFGDGLSQVQLQKMNHYPRCPNPSLTLGVPKHSDTTLISILQQGDVSGLQVLKDGHWIGVEPIPNAFVVNFGVVMQVISNGKLRSAEHRVVTHKSLARTTIGSTIQPSSNTLIEPAKALVSKSSPPLFNAFVYKDFVSTFMEDFHNGKSGIERYSLKV